MLVAIHDCYCIISSSARGFWAVKFCRLSILLVSRAWENIYKQNPLIKYSLIVVSFLFFLLQQRSKTVDKLGKKCQKLGWLILIFLCTHSENKLCILLKSSEMRVKQVLLVAASSPRAQFAKLCPAVLTHYALCYDSFLFVEFCLVNCATPLRTNKVLVVFFNSQRGKKNNQLKLYI